MSDSSDALKSLERELTEIFGTRLRSLVTYGRQSHHVGTDGNHSTVSHGHGPLTNTLNTLVTVETITGDDLKACALRVARWHDAGLATPLLLGTHEFDRALDAFPLEFGAILADHDLIAGTSPFENMRVDPADLRRACEVQARSHLLHLREGFLETRGRGDALALLLVQSAAPLAALLSSVARLDGQDPRDAAAAGRHVERALALAGGSLTDVVRLIAVSEIGSAEAMRLFPPYLDAVQRLVTYVDGWDTK